MLSCDTSGSSTSKHSTNPCNNSLLVFCNKNNLKLIEIEKYNQVEGTRTYLPTSDTVKEGDLPLIYDSLVGDFAQTTFLSMTSLFIHLQNTYKC